MSKKCMPLWREDTCHRFWTCYKTLTFCSRLRRCTIPCTCHAKRHLYVQKWSEPLVFDILTSKCALRHNSVHFFDISTSKSGPSMVCFVHFDFDMRFAPQRLALFRHHNFQKWSEPGVGYLKRICKDAFSVAGAVQEKLLGGPGSDFLRGAAFWSIRSSGLLR